MTDYETCGRADDCGLPAGWGTDHVGEGACKHHGGAGGDVGNSGGAPEGSANAETHALTSDPEKYYQRQSDAEQDRIDAWARSWSRRASYELPGYDTILHETAVTLHQIHQADDYIGERGVIVERIVDRTEGGRPITKDEENPAFQLKSRAMKDVIRVLKEFGCLDDPDSQQADAQQDTADALRAFMQSVDQ